MTGEIQADLWRVVGRSVCGASHRRRRASNQDAIGWSPAGASAYAVAVADGHGSAASFRSAAGATLAVQAALQTLGDFFQWHPDSAAATANATEIPADLIARWRTAIRDHLSGAPFTRDEVKALDRRGSEIAPDATARRAYGSTVLGVLATRFYVLCLQLGDGDILMVSDRGNVVRPWSRDPRLLGVETTSLCGADAAAEMRVCIEPLAGNSPALVLLATDGYANSFREDHGFLRIGGDLLEMIRQDGIEGVERDLETWLNEASELGSGDDITVALVCRTGEGSGNGR
jgi:serine/threonine protein phosphatase PrpC